ncbi:MAG: hypothetical protein ACXWMO_12090, partial [Syntrophales bacterium]
CALRFCRIRKKRDKDMSMPGQKITVRGRNGYFRVSEIDAIVFMDESAQISVYSSRHGKTPPVPVLSSILSIFSGGARDKGNEGGTVSQYGDRNCRLS